MTAPLSNDLRARVVGAIEAGESCRQPLRGFRFLGSEVAPALPDNRLGGAGQDGWPSQARSGAAPGVHRQRINQTSHLTLHGLKDELAARGVKVSHDTEVPAPRGASVQKNAVPP